MKRALAIILISLAAPASGLDLTLPGATRTAQQVSAADSVRLPRSAWQPGVSFPETEGAVRRTVYKSENSALTTLQLIEPLRTALNEAGYREVYSCADRACGGFDFRFQLDLLPAPEMFVDLGDYRYLLMEKPDANPKAVALVASGSESSGYLHVTEVFEAVSYDPPTESMAPVTPTEDNPDLVSRLVEAGHMVLADLDFATGSAELGRGPFESLETLADWLNETPGARVVLVGHTDSIGSLDANMLLSRRRALSVLNRLVDDLGVSPVQVASDGAGALSPIASNLVPEGRAANRRVEVVLLSIE